MIVVFAAWIVGGLLSMFGALSYAELGAAIPEAGGEYAYLATRLRPRLGVPLRMDALHCRASSLDGIHRCRAASIPGIPDSGSCRAPVHGSFPLADSCGASFRICIHMGAAAGRGRSHRDDVHQLSGRALGRSGSGGPDVSENRVGARHHRFEFLARPSERRLIFIHYGPRVWLGARSTHFLRLSRRRCGHTTAGKTSISLAPNCAILSGISRARCVGGVAFVASCMCFLARHVSMRCRLGLWPPRSTWRRMFSRASRGAALRSGSRLPWWSPRSARSIPRRSAAPASTTRWRATESFSASRATIHPRFRTPGSALIFQCCLASLFALTGTFEDLTSLFVFAGWIFYGLAVVAMFRMRKSEPNLPRPYRTWGYPVVPGLFVAGALALTVGIWIARPFRSSIGLALILSGLIFYRHWRKKIHCD